MERFALRDAILNECQEYLGGGGVWEEARKIKMAVINGNTRYISTISRKNRGLWTVYPYTLMLWFSYSETDELVAVVEFLESKSEVNPKEIALEKRKEMKKKRDIKSSGKKKGKKG